MATLKDKEMQRAAKEFAIFWQGKGYEKGESQLFWTSLLRNVFGIDRPEEFIEFEDQVHIDKSTGFIDGYIPETRVLIEQKSIEKDLRKAIKQSDGTLLTPFQQAKKYITELPLSRHPKWVITCNFKEFLIYDMENPQGEPESILLENLPKEYYRLSFLVDTGSDVIKREEEISIKAGEIVGKLYDALSKQYVNPDDEHSQRSLNVLCVRLVFCFYAEDAGVFGRHLMFHNYLNQFDTRHFRNALIDVFKVLNTKPKDRDPYLDDELAAFPYVNGGLFADDSIEIPHFTDEIRSLILENASEDFDWSQISPTIFGAVFESTLNPETRRSGGMHYTSVENIHKVIDPLFLDGLKEEFEEIKGLKQINTRNDKLKKFCEKLAGLKFLDPACGSGNFLTETYLSLRRLENDAIALINQDQIVFDDENIIRIKINQFYGIEINDFAVTVAKTALWIAESQMLNETEEIIHQNIDFLPLTTNACIVEGNALRIDWNEVVPASELNYIMGNPPFVGATMMTAKQKTEAVEIFGKIKLSNSIDYVGAWYFKAAELIKNTNIEVALVSTNSITQGEQVAPLWGTLFERYNIRINFAYRTFRWDSEANAKAHVHCVIVGFAAFDRKTKIIYEKESYKFVNNINPYLVDAPDVVISSRAKPLCNVPQMYLGNKPADGGNLIISKDEKETIINKEPELESWIHPYIGAEEYINNKFRYCFWLENAPISLLRNSPELRKRLLAVKQMREESTAEPTRKKAETPHLFFFISQPTTNYLLVPSTSSENRRYVPIGFISPDIIASNSTTIIANATLYHFGVLTSNVHMAWMRTVCGRLKSDYRYSGGVVYNNFPWPTPTEEQKAKIEQTAQAILDARALFPECSLADLYDELTMPPELRKAHQQNDRAVMEAYGFSVKITESECVAELMKMYQKLTQGK